MAFWRRRPKEPAPVQVVIDEESLVKITAAMRQMTMTLNQASEHMDTALKTGVKELDRATKELKKAQPRTKITNRRS